MSREGRCEACGAELVFVTTPKGAEMPCDAPLFALDVVKGGTVTGVTEEGRVVRGELRGPGETMVAGGFAVRTPHWATCASPDRFRRKR